VKALEFIPQSYNVKLHLAGNISTQKLRKELIELKGWDRVHYYGYVNRERALQIYSISKIGLLVLDDNKKYQQSDPVKLFEYMAAGIPFIMSNFTVWNKLLHKTKVALTCTYNSPKELANHIIYLLDNKEQAAEMAANARMLYEKHYSWELQERLFLNVYKNLLV
jgi:glycosyltransferase involved in cell wall biosynthesis